MKGERIWVLRNETSNHQPTVKIRWYPVSPWGFLLIWLGLPMLNTALIISKATDLGLWTSWSTPTAKLQSPKNTALKFCSKNYITLLCWVLKSYRLTSIYLSLPHFHWGGTWSQNHRVVNSSKYSVSSFLILTMPILYFQRFLLNGQCCGYAAIWTGLGSY